MCWKSPAPLARDALRQMLSLRLPSRTMRQGVFSPAVGPMNRRTSWAQRGRGEGRLARNDCPPFAVIRVAKVRRAPAYWETDQVALFEVAAPPRQEVPRPSERPDSTRTVAGGLGSVRQTRVEVLVIWRASVGRMETKASTASLRPREPSGLTRGPTASVEHTTPVGTLRRRLRRSWGRVFDNCVAVRIHTLASSSGDRWCLFRRPRSFIEGLERVRNPLLRGKGV